MGALKTLVIVMGIAILVGASVLVTLIVERGKRLAAGPSPVDEAAPVAGLPGFREHRLALPAGARVVESRLDGGRLLLRVALAEGGEALFVFDAANGRPVARYAITAEGP